ncbi:Lipoprotein NlpI precursor [Caulifigura coniformis]|uniref:Lipoprotein NlpI n=1 Tax=Caulifigura coniformis TaxID=2527983 RepID=A0A517SCI8_9PLAN|nr:tetratricopeptide repeat protein [Caulifigura coniformis]QDT53839.1 Lipoprotein NlpI precursor [Caulifigura coniformis]
MTRSMTRRDACRLMAVTPAILSLGVDVVCGAEGAHPLDAATLKEIRDAAESAIESANRQLAADPSGVAALSKRGDALFTLGRFEEAVHDYDAMLKADPSLDASHWRRGIACFYAGRAEEGAKQFERYHSFDNVDRENGIWRFLCQTKSVGLEKARESLLKYEKDDREPFPAVFKLFAGTITEQEILEGIAAAKISEAERQSRLFYADLYIGLNHAVQDRPVEAQGALARATKNAWPRTAGYGPRWMWHVGRVHWELLEAERQRRPS